MHGAFPDGVSYVIPVARERWWESGYWSHPQACCSPRLNEESRCNARRLLYSPSFKQGVSIPHAGRWVISFYTIDSDNRWNTKRSRRLHTNCLNANLVTLLDVQITNQCISFIGLIWCSIGTLLPTLIEKRHSMSGLHQVNQYKCFWIRAWESPWNGNCISNSFSDCSREFGVWSIDKDLYTRREERGKECLYFNATHTYVCCLMHNQKWIKCIRNCLNT